MKKFILVTAGLAICTLTVQSFVIAGNLTVSNGAKITIDTDTNVPGSPATDGFTFTPSVQVNIDGVSTANAWAAVSWHSQAVGKESGQGYGMAHDANRVFFTPLAGGTAPSMTGSNAASFGNEWVTNQ